MFANRSFYTEKYIMPSKHIKESSNIVNSKTRRYTKKTNSTNLSLKKIWSAKTNDRSNTGPKTATIDENGAKEENKVVPKHSISGIKRKRLQRKNQGYKQP